MQPFSANEQMVDRLVAEGALWSPPLIAAFRATPRQLFLDRVYRFGRRQERWRAVRTSNPSPSVLRLVYSDRALITRLSPRSRNSPQVPISSSSQPSLMAQMLEDLRPAAGQKVLEIGAGTGYNAALLAHVAGPGRVVSVDVDRGVLAGAWEHLEGFADRKVAVRHADGRHGFADEAPYDRIMVTAATPDLEPDWMEQLADGGVLVAPLVFAPGLAFVARGTVTAGVFRGRLTRAAYFMPLRAEAESGSTAPGPRPPGDSLRTLPAPWSGWFGRRRPRASWLRFTQSLSFFGFLRGLTVFYQPLAGGPAAYGLSDGRSICWTGAENWQVSGEAGRDLGLQLWRAFLDAGGPWPTEYRLTAGRGESPPAGGEAQVRQGERCRQVWERVELRERPGWL